jgi:hypothetical protein
VLALKNGVPVLAVDSVAGGHKISRQARLLEWPALLTIDDLDDGRLDELFDYCLSEEARRVAGECARRAVSSLRRVPADFKTGL